MKKTMKRTQVWWVAIGMIITLFAGCSGSGNPPPGITGSMASSAAVTIAPLATPSNITGSGSQSKIGLSWSASAGAAGYRVYRDGIFINFVTTASFLDVGLNASTTYCYSVSAVDAAGNESPLSAPVCITTLALLDATAPTILSTSPASQAMDVQTDPLLISAVFSEPMNMLSVINPASFTIGGVAGTTHYEPLSNTVIFIPLAALSSGTTYTATIRGNVADAFGNLMGVDHIWSFTTTTAPLVTLPTVISTGPADNGTNVPVDAVITAVFSEPMDPLTIMNPPQFTISPGVQGLVSYDIASRTAIFTPSAPLAPATTYTGTISNNVQDLAGHRMTANHTWSFTTAP
jgi:hypothetical protein